MLWGYLDFFIWLESHIYEIVNVGTRPLVQLWTNLWIEWIFLQTLLMYALYKIYATINPLRQIMATMWFIVLICLYLGLWQLELFACFLFLGEFTIMIFFYCLFLHLKTAINQINTVNNLGSHNIALLLISLFFIIYLYYTKYYQLGIEELSILFINIYNVINDFLINDLAFLYYFFINANVSVHVLIGMTLFILTIFLFLVVVLYTSISVNKISAFKIAHQKLLVSKGYYEQTSYSSQKFFSKN